MIAEVIIDIANSSVDKVFDYEASDDIKKGQRVLVPFGNRSIEGYVINLKQTSNVEQKKLKSILKPLDSYAILTEEFLALSDYMQKHDYLKKVDTLRLFLPSGMRKNKVKNLERTVYVVNSNFNKELFINSIRKNAVMQQKLLEFLTAGQTYTSSYLNQEFGAAAVKKFNELGVLEKKTEQVFRKPELSKREVKNVVLTDEQQFVVNEIETNKDKVHLLFGVTGSGKTEVYMNVISDVLKQGKTAIMLVPEISLTPQIAGSFTARFLDNVAVLHSGLSVGERFDEWQRIREGKAKIVVGARSAIFAPLDNLGVIIIDEEHDGSYKSESNPRFYTHDVAAFRAKFNNCPLVLGSATPSINSFYKAKMGEYNLLTLTKRANNRQMPPMEIVDLCAETNAGNTGLFSRRLVADLTECVKTKNQAMIFVNRRGFASYIICRDCGYIAKCEDCDASLVYHKEDKELKCHFCGKRYRALTNCPNCKGTHIKTGAIGTEKVVEELKNLFPDVKILRMDFDNTQNKNAHSKILEEFSGTTPSILVGTQMIAKGHDFPNVTLVGIIDADMSLHFSDYRSCERTFQLVTQVAGRAGRADKYGKVVLQTYSPRHYVYRFAANYNYNAFYEKEINLRETSKFPPFATIIRILVSSENEEFARQVGLKIYLPICKFEEENRQKFLFCRSGKSPVSRIQKRFRYQILLRVKAEFTKEMLNFVYDVVKKEQSPKASVFVEINPSNLS